MKQNLIKKPCLVCKTSIGIGLFTNREEIIRCPNCGALLIENPKRKKLSLLISFVGIFLLIGLNYWFGIGFSGSFALILIFYLIISAVLINFTSIKKDFIIRNKLTNKISYINKPDWNEIIKKSLNKENNFEIIEELKPNTTANSRV